MTGHCVSFATFNNPVQVNQPEVRKPGAHFINIAHGRRVVTEDLIAAAPGAMSSVPSRCPKTVRFGECPTC
jgi:hypothetical protein